MLPVVNIKLYEEPFSFFKKREPTRLGLLDRCRLRFISLITGSHKELRDIAATISESYGKDSALEEIAMAVVKVAAKRSKDRSGDLSISASLLKTTIVEVLSTKWFQLSTNQWQGMVAKINQALMVYQNPQLHLDTWDQCVGPQYKRLYQRMRHPNQETSTINWLFSRFKSIQQIPSVDAPCFPLNTKLNHLELCQTNPTFKDYLNVWPYFSGWLNDVASWLFSRFKSTQQIPSVDGPCFPLNTKLNHLELCQTNPTFKDYLNAWPYFSDWLNDVASWRSNWVKTIASCESSTQDSFLDLFSKYDLSTKDPLKEQLTRLEKQFTELKKKFLDLLIEARSYYEQFPGDMSAEYEAVTIGINQHMQQRYKKFEDSIAEIRLKIRFLTEEEMLREDLKRHIEKMPTLPIKQAGQQVLQEAIESLQLEGWNIAMRQILTRLNQQVSIPSKILVHPQKIRDLQAQLECKLHKLKVKPELFHIRQKLSSSEKDSLNSAIQMTYRRIYEKSAQWRRFLNQQMAVGKSKTNGIAQSLL